MTAKTTNLTLVCPSFAHGDAIAARHTCDGANVSPELRWSGVSNNAQSFVLIVEDPDAPSGTFTHWVLFDIPGALRGLHEGAAGVGVSGRNDFRTIGYRGPCPPPGHGQHRYYFRLYALDVPSLKLPLRATHQDAEIAMQFHILEQAELMGVYERPPS